MPGPWPVAFYRFWQLRLARAVSSSVDRIRLMISGIALHRARIISPRIPSFRAALGLADCPFGRPAHREHSHSQRTLRLAGAELGQPVLVHADRFALILGHRLSQKTSA